MFRITIEEFGNPAEETDRLEFRLESSNALSVRELIHRTVAEEIRLRGLKVSEAKLTDHQREATRAFARGTFVMLVSGKPMTDIESVLPADDEREIFFIRVLPLVGG